MSSPTVTAKTIPTNIFDQYAHFHTNIAHSIWLVFVGLLHCHKFVWISYHILILVHLLKVLSNSVVLPFELTQQNETPSKGKCDSLCSLVHELLNLREYIRLRDNLIATIFISWIIVIILFSIVALVFIIIFIVVILILLVHIFFYFITTLKYFTIIMLTKSERLISDVTKNIISKV